MSSGTSVTRFLYDGDKVIEEHDGAGTRLRFYAHGPGTDEPLIWYELTGGPGNLVGKRDPTETENKRFTVFNARYTAAVNRLARNPDRSVTVAAIHGKLGSFQTTAGRAAASMISREFLYIGKWNTDKMMVSPGVYSPHTGQMEGAATWVTQLELGAHEAGVVHDGGLHATPEEWTGGLQAFPSPLAKYDHQKQYNDAACKLLGQTNCEP